MFVWKFNKEMRRYNNLSDIESVMDDGGRPKANQRERAGRNRRAAKSRAEGKRRPFKGSGKKKKK